MKRGKVELSINFRMNRTKKDVATRQKKLYNHWKKDIVLQYLEMFE